MIITLKNKEHYDDSELTHLLEFIKKAGFEPRLSKGARKTVIELIGFKNASTDDFLKFNCVEEVHRIQKPYKRISLESHRESHVVSVGSKLKIGSEKLVIMMGPCAVESYEQTRKIAELMSKYKLDNNFIEGFILRGGAYKPRTSPYAFEGLGEEGLKILRKVSDEFHFPVITEVMSEYDVDVVNQYADIHQVGTRNFQNFKLLDKLGKVNKPVLLKRGMSGTIDELLLAAERIASKGNQDIILCLRGIRTFNDAYRNDVDVADVVRLKQLCCLPVIFDPSHSTGNRDAILPVTAGAVMMGVDGVLVDLHYNPEEALVDGPQALWPAQGEAFIKTLIIAKKAQQEAKKIYLSSEEARKLALS